MHPLALPTLSSTCRCRPVRWVRETVGRVRSVGDPRNGHQGQGEHLCNGRIRSSSPWIQNRQSRVFCFCCMLVILGREVRMSSHLFCVWLCSCGDFQALVLGVTNDTVEEPRYLCSSSATNDTSSYFLTRQHNILRVHPPAQVPRASLSEPGSTHRLLCPFVAEAFAALRKRTRQVQKVGNSCPVVIVGQTLRVVRIQGHGRSCASLNPVSVFLSMFRSV